MIKKDILPLTDPSGISMGYLYEMRVRGGIIYLAVLIAVSTGLGLLPFIYVGTTVKGDGSVIGAIGKNDISAAVTGDSVDSSLAVTVVVGPKEVRHINPGQEVRLHVGNHGSEWHYLKARVDEIPEQIELDADGRPIFRIKCSLVDDLLRLSDGKVFRLKAGMSVRARFVVPHRNLFQLIFGKVG